MLFKKNIFYAIHNFSLLFKPILDDTNFKLVDQEIGNVFEDGYMASKGNNTNTLMHKCFMIKLNISGMLDMCRKTYIELNENINGLQNLHSCIDSSLFKIKNLYQWDI